MRHAVHKTKGGLVRISAMADGKIREIQITGDFFIFPEDSVELLEKELLGIKTERRELLKVVKELYKKNNIESPGINPEDFVEAIEKAINKSVSS